LNEVVTAPVTIAPIDELAVLRLTGADTHAFLQGQLSADVGRLTHQHSQLASLNSAQGRVQAVLRLVADGEDVLLVLPAELRARVAERLRRYVLRAQVKVDAEPADWACYWSSGTASAAGIEPPAESAGAASANAGRIAIRVAAHEDRWLLLAPPGQAEPASRDGSAAWRLAEIRAGHPQVYAPTWETFVAQMLNLDALDAVSFAKGCYIGQEIIARAHYRGAVKRRMVRLRVAGAAPAPGTRILAGDAHAGEVVYGEVADAGAECLAVISLARLGDALKLESGSDLERLPLPYAIE